MQITETQKLKKDLLEDFFTTHWGSTVMVISSGTYDCTSLDGYVAILDNNIVGVVTYIIAGKECEIISLDSTLEGKGIGTALMKKVEETAGLDGCSSMKLITTNDNLHALKFYQKRGYRMTAIYRDAVEKARKHKPEIPETGHDGIPIRDEILLEKDFAR